MYPSPPATGTPTSTNLRPRALNPNSRLEAQVLLPTSLLPKIIDPSTKISPLLLRLQPTNQQLRLNNSLLPTTALRPSLPRRWTVLRRRLSNNRTSSSPLNFRIRSSTSRTRFLWITTRPETSFTVRQEDQDRSTTSTREHRSRVRTNSSTRLQPSREPLRCL